MVYSGCWVDIDPLANWEPHAERRGCMAEPDAADYAGVNKAIEHAAAQSHALVQLNDKRWSSTVQPWPWGTEQPHFPQPFVFYWSLRPGVLPDEIVAVQEAMESVVKESGLDLAGVPQGRHDFMNGYHSVFVIFVVSRQPPAAEPPELVLPDLPNEDPNLAHGATPEDYLPLQPSHRIPTAE